MPIKQDTKDTNLLITGLKEGATYELVIKASNDVGSSMLTEPVKFSTQEKYITSAASLGGKQLDFLILFELLLCRKK